MDLLNRAPTAFQQHAQATSSGNSPCATPSRRLAQNTAAALTALPPSSPLASLENRTRNHVSPQHLQKPLSSPIPIHTQAHTISSRSSTPILRTRSSLGSVLLSHPLPPIRRTSSTLAPLANTQTMRKTPPTEDPQPPPMTAAQIARCFFQEDLKAHERVDGSQSVEVAIILHDACYGHRYARPKTSKASLSTIVERPERIKATVMGLAAAYVRLGERHAEGRYSPQTQRQPKLPIPFTIHKSSSKVSLTDPTVMNVHGNQWMQDLTTMCKDAESKLAMNGKELVRPSSELNNNLYVENAKLHEGDLYLCAESLDALEGSLGAVCDAIDRVFNSSMTKRAFVSIRPPGHHCSADYPSGFCWINNVHIGISHAAKAHGLTHAAIIDFDLHHGDGSQAITWAHNAAAQRLPKNASAFRKTSIGYFSLHDINSYPCEYGDEEKVQNASLCIENAHGQTIWNTHLQPWKKESEFWHLYDTRYSILIEKARAFLLHHSMNRRQSASQLPPKAAIFISAGFDASEWEGSGMQRHKVNVPTEFYARFTRDIVDLADEDGLGVAGRVISVLEGGYSDRALSSGVLSHVCGLASSGKQKNQDLDSNSLSQEIASRLGNLRIDKREDGNKAPFDCRWWSPEYLEELENVSKVAQPAIPIRKQPNGLAPTYTTPTQASTAKAVSPLLSRHSTSTSTAASLQRSASSASSRPPTPPCPEVDWATAARELYGLLVPTNRSTASYKHEELNAQATRIRKDRQSILPPVDEATTPDGKRMQLRERKSKPTQSKQTEGEKTTINKTNRRKTIADAASLATESRENVDVFKPAARPVAKAPMRRRSSVASTTISTIDEDLISGPQDSYRTESLEAGRKPSSSIVESHARPPAGNSQDLSVHKRGRPAVNAVPAAPRSRKGVAERPPPASRVSSSQTKPGPIQSASSYMLIQNERASGDSIAPTGTDIDGLISGVKKINLKLNPPRKPGHEVPSVPKKAPASRAPRKVAEMAAPKSGTSQTNASAITSQDVALPPQTFKALKEVPISNGNSKLPTQELLRHYENENIPALVEEQPPTAPAPFIPAFTAPNGPTITATADRLENAPSLTKIVRDESGIPLASSTASTSMPLAPLVNHQITSPKRTKTELPIFTATTPIMFAPHDRSTASIDNGSSQSQNADRMRPSEDAIINDRSMAMPMPDYEVAGEPSGNHERAS